MSRKGSVELNPDLVRELIEAGKLTIEETARRAGIDEKTLRNALKGQRVHRETVNRIAGVLGMDVAAPPGRPVRRGRLVRDVSGVWEGTAVDVVVPGNEYAVPPVTYRLAWTISQTGTTFTVAGTVGVRPEQPQPFSARGDLLEDGNFLRLEWDNDDAAIRDYGTAMLEYAADGRELNGFFLGREKGHGTSLVIGRVTARRPPAS